MEIWKRIKHESLQEPMDMHEFVLRTEETHGRDNNSTMYVNFLIGSNKQWDEDQVRQWVKPSDAETFFKSQSL